MNNLSMYCLSLNPKHLDIIKKLNYIPVGLGKSTFSKEWETDKFKDDISKKNEFYGEYTFHYKLWKNKEFKSDHWIGFCQYRKFWTIKKTDHINLNIDKLKNCVLKNIPKNLNNFDVILGKEFYVNEFKLAKFLKKNFYKIVRDPLLLFNKNRRNIKFHFDMMHGYGNLDKAISLLEKKERTDFNDYVNTNVFFNPHNMFICKKKNILLDYYNSVFPWLLNCEKVFGFSNLRGYGLKRIYGFLAERYMSYWFNKYAKTYTLPIIFKDITDYL